MSSSPDIRTEAERRHVQNPYSEHCLWCSEPWPCNVRALLDQPASKPDDAAIYELWDRDSGNIVGQFDLQRLVETVAFLAAQGMKPEHFSARLTNPETDR